MSLPTGEVISLSEIMHFIRSQSILIGSITAVGIGLVGIRRYCAGGRCRSDARLDGKTVIITGSNTGLGKETVKDIARRGAKIIMACRDITKAERAADSIRKETGNQNVIVRVLDLASLESVRAFSKQIKETEPRLDILINNAGVMACPKWQTADGFEMQMGTNHLGHFLLTNELVDLMKTSAPSRVVNVASTAHTRGKINFEDLNMDVGYEPFKAYARSKLANILFTRELHKRLKGTGVTTYALHPGVINTELGRHMPVWVSFPFFFLFKIFLKTPEEGAQTSIYCAVTEGIEKDSGKYFSDCAVKTPKPQAEDDEAARRLWEVSEQLVGLKKKA